MTDTKIAAAEHHLLVAFAHCEDTPLNGAPMQAQQPSDLSTWVWLDDRKVSTGAVEGSVTKAIN